MRQVRSSGNQQEDVSQVGEPILDDGRTHDPYMDADGLSTAPSERRQSDEFEDADEYIDDGIRAVDA